MPKKTLISWLFILCMPMILVAQNGTITGKVTDKVTGDALSGANITIVGTDMGAAADSDGHFTIANVPPGTYTLKASFIGFLVTQTEVTVVVDETATVDFSLNQSSIYGEEITVTSSWAEDRETPVAFTNISVDQIATNFTVQDVPHLFKNTPGIYVTTDGGSGLGDSKVYIRGFDEQRTSTQINGIEENDPESKKVYWSNWGQLPGGSKSIQIQRGVGSSLYGAGAFGGSINVLTAEAAGERSFRVVSTGGRYNTFKLGLDFDTGLMKGKHAFLARVNYITGNGWRRDTFYRGLQYYFTYTNFLNDKSTLRLVLHGAPQYHAYSYFSFSAKDLARYGRDYNPHPYVKDGDSGLTSRETDGTSLLDLLFMRHNNKDKGGEVIGNNFVSFDNNVFHKPQLEAHLTRQMGPKTFWKTTAFYTIGRGYGENINSSFLIKRNGDEPGMMNMQDIINAGQYQYRNHSIHNQFGLLTSLKTDWKGHEVSVGAEGRYWWARHYGLVLNTFGKETTSIRVGGEKANFRAGDVYYDYTGYKPNFSVFAHALWKFDKLSIMTDGQFSLRHYRIKEAFPSGNNRPVAGGTYVLTQNLKGGNNDGFVNNSDVRYNLLDFTNDFNFFAPKVGANYNFTDAFNLFANWSRAYNEPRVKYFFNLGQPQEELPIERSDDFELGFGLTQSKVNIKVNLYQINFKNKAFRIQDGTKANQPGYDYKGRRYVQVGSARYRGVEIAAGAEVLPGLELTTSVSKMKNAWTDDITQEAKDDLGIQEGDIEPETPQLIVAGVVNFTKGHFYASGAIRYFNDYYIKTDNSEVAIEYDLVADAASKSSTTLPSWTVADLILGYKFRFAQSNLNLSLHMNNLFNAEYFQIGNRFGLLPGPERNFQVNLAYELR
ncbi:MAG: TonB-dependent receptor [bacterium]